MVEGPNFSAYPWHALPRLSRDEAALQSLVARWLSPNGAHGVRLARLIGGKAGSVEVRAELQADARVDGFAARAIVQVGNARIDVLGDSLGVRALAQRLLGGPDELAAPRPLGVVEQSIWTLVVATALEDIGVAGKVLLHVDSARPRTGRSASTSTRTIGLGVTLGEIRVVAEIRVPPDLALRVPSARPAPWTATVMFDVALVVGRCALHRDDLARLALRQLITLEASVIEDPDRARARDTFARTSSEHVTPSHATTATSTPATSMMTTTLPATTSPAPPGGRYRPPADVRSPVVALDLFGGTVALRVRLGDVVGEVVTGYVRRDMSLLRDRETQEPVAPANLSLPDDAHVELTVALGTTQLSLRQVTELAVGQIVSLGRPLAGPFELRAAGRVLGRGELVDVDGELAVRILSLGQ